MTYAELAYEEVPLDVEYVNGFTREKLMEDAIERWEEGKVCLS